jgi:hypothetical protein
MYQDDWFFLIVDTFKTRMTNCPSFFYVLQHSKLARQMLVHGGGFFHIVATSKTRTTSCTDVLVFFVVTFETTITNSTRHHDFCCIA